MKAIVRPSLWGWIAGQLLFFTATASRSRSELVTVGMSLDIGRSERRGMEGTCLIS